MSWVALDRAERAVLALFKSLDRDRVLERRAERRAEVATELVVSLQKWTQKANAARHDAFLELYRRGWSVEEIRERFGIDVDA